MSVFISTKWKSVDVEQPEEIESSEYLAGRKLLLFSSSFSNLRCVSRRHLSRWTAPFESAAVGDVRFVDRRSIATERLCKVHEKEACWCRLKMSTSLIDDRFLSASIVLEWIEAY